MCSELTPRARIPDTRIPQFMQPWCPWTLFKGSLPLEPVVGWLLLLLVCWLLHLQKKNILHIIPTMVPPCPLVPGIPETWMHPNTDTCQLENLSTLNTPQISMFHNSMRFSLLVARHPDLVKKTQMLESKDDRVFEVVVASAHLNSFKPPVSRQNSAYSWIARILIQPIAKIVWYFLV